MDEDGFHSISWDDAPPRTGFADMSGVGDDDDDGFDKISPTSPPALESSLPSGSASTATVRAASGTSPTITNIAIDPDNYEWEGRQMTVEVKDPVKEHEGSKDMYVSYAVQTRVSSEVLAPNFLLGYSTGVTGDRSVGSLCLLRR